MRIGSLLLGGIRPLLVQSPRRLGMRTLFAFLIVGLSLPAHVFAEIQPVFISTWGKDVDTSGDGTPDTCTVAADCQAGTIGSAAGQFFGAALVGADNAGNVYVPDSGNHRAQKFDSNGNFLRMWGRDVVTGGGTGAEICTSAATCKAGVVGGKGGELNTADGLSVDSGNNVYVSEAAGRRVQKFDSSGNFLRAWGKDVVTGGGTDAEICTSAAACKGGLIGGGKGGEFRSAVGLAVGIADNVYVVEQFNHSVHQFDSSGNFLRKWGKDVVAGGGSGAEICTSAAACKIGVLGGKRNLSRTLRHLES